MRISSLRKFVSVQAPPPRGSRRDDESGLTTLEWLLIVAAVAGLAALAVVLVQNVVDRTAEQVSSSSARYTAAVVAAQQIIDNANRPAAEQPPGAKKWGDWKNYYNAQCRRLGITYNDAGITATPGFATNGSVSYIADDGDVATNRIDLTSGGPRAAAATVGTNRAGAHCQVSQS